MSQAIRFGFPRRGVTMVEILVVIAIITVLGGLLFPAIQAARESARLVHCGNNLKQLGVALTGYASSAGRLPAGVAANVWRSSDADTTEVGPIAKYGFYYWTTFLHLLLPRLEEQAYYDGLRGPLFRLRPIFNLTASEATRDWAAINGVPLPPLLCPSDGVSGPLWQPATIHSGTVRLAKSNYLGLFSGTSVAEGTVTRSDLTNATDPREKLVFPLPPRWLHDRRAVFGYGRGIRLNDVRDGTANTIAVSEYLRGPSERDGRGAIWYNDAGMQFLHATTAPNSAVPDRLYQDRVATANNPDDWGCFSRMRRVQGVQTRVAETPNNRPDLNLPCIGGAETGGKRGYDGFATPRSRHPGVVNAVFCDGHVEQLADEVETSTVSPYGVWQRLIWIDDAQPINR
jgi:prepilin-type processing-associated H-X9-DG protein/prepilin-type N-terminal cleavage/methylation domain-containing protein